MKLFELADFAEALAATAEAAPELVLVGGHAVSYYAEQYKEICPGLGEHGPFTSKDIDLLGTIDEGMLLARHLGRPWKMNPRKGGFMGLALGSIHLADEPEEVKVEILHQILGSTHAEVRTSAVTESYRERRLRVINPLLLYVVKGINLARLDQTRRQDGKQFAVMGLVVREVLRQLTELPGAERAFLKAVGRLIEFSLSGDGLKLIARGAADPPALLPAGLDVHASDSLRNFAAIRLPRWREELRLAGTTPAG